MKKTFPDIVKSFPKADVPLEGLQAWLAQGEDHQILFMEFDKDVELPEHSHAAQGGIVLKGRIDLTIDGVHRSYEAGESYHIPEGVLHSGKIYAGYADITVFGQADRYGVISDTTD